MSDEKKNSAATSKIRLSAIDRFRGLVIIYMIFGHSMLYWLIPQDSFYAGFVLLTWENTFCGAAAFIFLAGMSMSLSYNSYARRVQANLANAVQEKWNGRLQIWIRTVWIAGLAVLTNLIGSIAQPPLMIWIWYVLQTMWVARAVIYPLLHWSNWYRLILGFLIIILADPIRQSLATTSPLLYQIFFNGVTLNPFFPYVGFFFVGSALGHWVDQWSRLQMKGKTIPLGIPPKANRFLRYFTPKSILIIGIIISILGILFGLEMNSSVVIQETIQRLNVLPGWNIQALPAFIVHGNSSMALHTLGFDLVVFALFFYSDFSKLNVQLTNQMPPPKSSKLPEQTSVIAKKTYKNSSKALTLFGQQSLTVYLSHYLVFFIFIKQLWMWQWFIIAPLFVALYHTIIWIWANGPGKGHTIDWAIGTTTEMAVKAILKRKKFFIKEKE